MSPPHAIILKLTLIAAAKFFGEPSINPAFAGTASSYAY